MSSTPTAALLLTALLCATPACGGSPAPGLDDDCQFTATIVGADSVELCGLATSSGRAGEGWSLQLLTPGGQNSILLLTVGAGRPAPGTYDVVNYVSVDATPSPDDYVTLVALEGDLLGATGFFSVEGTLTITSSSESEVAGSFHFEARDGSDAHTVTAEGTFRSTNKDL